MVNHYDIAYTLGAALCAPYWLAKPGARRKVMSALAARAGPVAQRTTTTTGIMIHAVSVGEINATRQLIAKLREARPGGLHFIVTATTDTGFARGRELYGADSDVTVVRYPLDFTGPILGLLDNLRPAVVVLVELEVWPNFLRQCRQKNIPVILINGRLTEGSFRRYRLIGPLARRMFRQVRQICAQDAIYAGRFIELGSDPGRTLVTGTMKFDTADCTRDGAAAAMLAGAVGLDAEGEQAWVCGSTGPGEESIILSIYRRLLARFPQLRLIIVPRKPERFDEVAGLIGAAGFGCVRRSKPTAALGPAVILGDTMGELRTWYGLAGVVFVGRTLVDLGARQHGSDMIEPAALARPVMVGRYTGNFAEPMAKFVKADAIKVVMNELELEEQTAHLLTHRDQAQAQGARARQVVINEQGATDRHVKMILELIS